MRISFLVAALIGSTLIWAGAASAQSTTPVPVTTTVDLTDPFTKLAKAIAEESATGDVVLTAAMINAALEEYSKQKLDPLQRDLTAANATIVALQQLLAAQQNRVFVFNTFNEGVLREAVRGAYRARIATVPKAATSYFPSGFVPVY